MRRKKKPGERYSFRRAMGFGTQTVQTVLYGRPVLHVDCGGALEIENCRSILQYDAEKLKLDMGELSVTIEGNELVVDTYQKRSSRCEGRCFPSIWLRRSAGRLMNRLARYAMGSVNFEVTGGRGERFLNDCVNAGVPVEHIRPTQTGYLATVPLRDYKRMHKYARRSRCRLRVRENTAHTSRCSHTVTAGGYWRALCCASCCCACAATLSGTSVLQFYAGAGSIRPRAAA